MTDKFCFWGIFHVNKSPSFLVCSLFSEEFMELINLFGKNDIMNTCQKALPLRPSISSLYIYTHCSILSSMIHSLVCLHLASQLWIQIHSYVSLRRHHHFSSLIYFSSSFSCCLFQYKIVTVTWLNACVYSDERSWFEAASVQEMDCLVCTPLCLVWKRAYGLHTPTNTKQLIAN